MVVVLGAGGFVGHPVVGGGRPPVALHPPHAEGVAQALVGHERAWRLPALGGQQGQPRGRAPSA